MHKMMNYLTAMQDPVSVDGYWSTWDLPDLLATQAVKKSTLRAQDNVKAEEVEVGWGQAPDSAQPEVSELEPAKRVKVATTSSVTPVLRLTDAVAPVAIINEEDRDYR